MKTLSEVCPLWDEKIKEQNLNDENHLSLGHRKYCLVGEAHRYNEKYCGCNTCYVHSITLFTSAGGKLFPYPTEKLEVNDLFLTEVQAFLTHFNEVHIKHYESLLPTKTKTEHERHVMDSSSMGSGSSHISGIPNLPYNG